MYKINKQDTELGSVRIKTSYGAGITKSSYEYEDLKELAKLHHVSLQEVISLLENKDQNK